MGSGQAGKSVNMQLQTFGTGHQSLIGNLRCCVIHTGGVITLCLVHGALMEQQYSSKQ
jgi:hypothetical protein